LPAKQTAFVEKLDRLYSLEKSDYVYRLMSAANCDRFITDEVRSWQ